MLRGSQSAGSRERHPRWHMSRNPSAQSRPTASGSSHAPRRTRPAAEPRHLDDCILRLLRSVSANLPHLRHMRLPAFFQTRWRSPAPRAAGLAGTPGPPAAAAASFSSTPMSRCQVAATLRAPNCHLIALVSSARATLVGDRASPRRAPIRAKLSASAFPMRSLSLITPSATAASSV